jgi:hypothetical protein
LEVSAFCFVKRAKEIEDDDDAMARVPM